MKRLIVYGTGNAAVTKCYNTCYSIFDGNEHLLVDAGGGNQILTILENKNISLNSIKNVFVSHAHTDHVLGIVWILRMIGQAINKGKYEGNLNVYCHKELKDKIRTICDLTLNGKVLKLFDERIIFNVVQNGEERKIMGMDFKFFDILSTKEKQFGFTLNTEGKKITFLGDEPLSPDLDTSYIENADWLFSEAFCKYDDKDKFKPYEKHHSTVKDAAEIASKYNVKNVILWHTEDSDLTNRKESYTKEAKKYFNGNIYVPNDLEEIDLV